MGSGGVVRGEWGGEGGGGGGGGEGEGGGGGGEEERGVESHAVPHQHP